MDDRLFNIVNRRSQRHHIPTPSPRRTESIPCGEERAKVGEGLSHCGGGCGQLLLRKKLFLWERASEIGDGMEDVEDVEDVEDGGGCGKVWASGKSFFTYRDFQQSALYRP